MKCVLEALQARDGDCLLLHYEPDAGSPSRILIDGGAAGVYRTVLKPRLDQLRANGPLDLRMAIVSHIDADHITGLVDLFKSLKDMQDDGEDPFCRVQTLWHNSFSDLHGQAPARFDSGAVGASMDGQPIDGLDEYTRAVVASVPQGNRLRDYATQLSIPLNQGVSGPLVLAPEHGRVQVGVAEGLTFTVLAPHQAQLDQLQEEWAKAKTNNPANPAAQAADYLNATAPNMSSIVVLAEAVVAPNVKRTMLLTGDARGDVMLNALNAVGLSTDGRIHVDLLKVQHHGSSHSTTQDFFERVTADRYVISGNGKSNNPHPDALRWLSKARHGKPYEAYLTNRTGVNDLGTVLDAFLAEEAASEPLHIYHFREDPDLSITVDLT